MSENSDKNPTDEIENSNIEITENTDDVKKTSSKRKKPAKEKRVIQDEKSSDTTVSEILLDDESAVVTEIPEEEIDISLLSAEEDEFKNTVIVDEDEDNSVSADNDVTLTEVVDADEAEITDPKEEKCEDAESVSESPQSSEIDERLVNVEHFSDYKSRAEIEKEALPLEDVEYENLTILDDEIFDEGDIVAALPHDEQDSYYDESTEETVKADEDDTVYDPKKPRKIDGRFELIELFIFTLVAVMILTTFFFRHSVVEGQSMENTLWEGEHLIITDLFYTPKNNDIIVFEDYSTGFKKPIVKRVIATEGQTVQIKIDGVYVDGQKLDEDYVYIDPEDDFNYLEDILPQYYNGYTVPEGELVVMGDHRNHSTDSREFGTISEESVLGKVILRFYPLTKDKFGKVE